MEPRPSRRRLGLLAWFSMLPLGFLWRAMAHAHGNRPRAPRRHRVSGPVAEGLTVDGPVVLWRAGDTIAAFSRRCPHLGCTVRPAGDGGLACPCHGSRFDGRGRVERGPATADLTPLRISREAEGNGLVVDLSS
jgi:nitrite reductase/ring-hydroxylating ferredoxin subunit